MAGILAAAALSTATAAGLSLEEIGRELITVEAYSDSCIYEVLQPTLPDPVEYTLRLRSVAVGADTLSPCNYFIQWNLEAPSGTVHGFSAYFGGDHYRFGGNRLQEYHAAIDATPFMPSGRVENGVQRRAQFIDLLPQTIGGTFLTMASDTTYSTRITERPGFVTVKGTRRISGFDAMEFEYTLDPSTKLPTRIDLINNPGQPGEQNVTVRYLGLSSEPASGITYDAIAQAEPDAFELYRTDTYSLEQAVGLPLPQIALPTLNGDRYIHHRGDAMPAVSFLVFLDSSVGSTPAVIDAVRDACSRTPGASDIIWMFIDKRKEDVAPLISGAETCALNAGSAARDLGVGALTPCIIAVDRAGTVRGFIRGFNNHLASDVIELFAICK